MSAELDDDCGRCEYCDSLIDHCTVHDAECCVCGMQGCSQCIHDGGDDIYPELCEACDP